MAVIEVEVKSPDGASQPGSARFVAVAGPTRRWLVVGFGAGGILTGGLSILTPGPHLVIGWLAPLLGIVAALVAARLTGWFSRVNGTCPSCGHPFDEPGPGPAWAEDPTLPCPRCGVTLDIRIPPSTPARRVTELR